MTSPPPPPSPSTRNIAWIVIVSLLAAVVLALVLVILVVPGARENVIAAAVLFAFAAGAALLAGLSARRSDQPQRWARTVAGWLAVAGALLAMWPGVVATDAIAWVAPVLLLALAGWMTIRVRRELHSRIRIWLVYPVFAVVALAAVAAGYETGREALERGTPPAAGRLIEVGGGRRMYLNCTGSGTPVVVLLPGHGGFSSTMSWIAPAVAQDTRVCVYDRAGRGWSDPAPNQQDGTAVAADLAALLAAGHEAPPYVLAGHSFGGLYVRTFAARYPERTAGLVLLDATDPMMFTRIPAYPGFYWFFNRVSALFPSLARFGLVRLVNQHASDSLPSESRPATQVALATARLARSQRDEFAAAPLAMEQAGSLVLLGDRPLLVVTALKDAMDGWTTVQDELPRLSTNSSHWIIPTATHASLVEYQTEAAFSSQAIREVVAAVRTSAPVARH